MKGSAFLKQYRAKPVNPTRLNSKISNLNRSLYRAELCQSYLVKLEKSVIRGESKETKSERKHRVEIDFYSSSPEHKVNKSGLNIFELPRLPFGTHRNYNSDEPFLASHFVEQDNISPSQLKELETRERDQRKIRISKTNKVHKKPVFTDFEHSNVYDTEAGKLVCKKNDAVTHAYDEAVGKAKKKKNDSLIQRKRRNPIEKQARRDLEKQSVGRLIRSPKSTAETYMTRTYLTRYPVLFENN